MTSKYTKARSFLNIVGDRNQRMDGNWTRKSVQLKLRRWSKETDLYETFRRASDEYLFQDYEMAFLLSIPNPKIGKILFGPAAEGFTDLTDDAKVLASILYIEHTFSEKDQHVIPAWMLPTRLEAVINVEGWMMGSREYVDYLIDLHLDNIDDQFIS